MRRLIVHFLLGVLAAWTGSIFVPHVVADGSITTFLLIGFLLAIGEVVIMATQGAVAVVLFFLPSGLRRLLLRGVSVGIASAITAGFGFTSLLPGLLGMTLLVSLLYWLPFAR